ncbi:MAG TPA: N-acetyltransferase [Acidimicrobiales bacterium]|nr:N-acetyltransferase [Acidimicrobiales bacterium]
MTRPPTFVAPSAQVEEHAEIGAHVAIWQHSKVRHGARVGAGTRIGGGVYVGVGVVVGENSKIENGAQLFEGSRLGRGVFVGPCALLLNDRYPRATTPAGVIKDGKDWEVEGVTVDEGASVGGGAVLLPGARIGAWALVGGGSVVVGEIAPYALVVGNPARRVGTVCRCGRPFGESTSCASCGVRLERSGDSEWPQVVEPA